MDVEQLKKDVRSGNISLGRLIKLIVALQREVQAAKQQTEQLERQLGVPPSSHQLNRLLRMSTNAE